MAAILRPQALEYLRNLVAEGIKQRDLFVHIVVDQDDWIGAITKPETFQDAIRLDLAQQALLKLASDPNAQTEDLIHGFEAELDTMALSMRGTPSMYTKFRKSALEQIVRGLGGTQRLQPRV